MLVGIIIGAVVLLLIIFVISSYNKLVKQKVNVEEAFATMDVYLKKRFDLIPNLVETKRRRNVQNEHLCVTHCCQAHPLGIWVGWQQYLQTGR